MYKEPPGPLADASMTDKRPRRLELHVKGEWGPSLAVVSGLSSQSQALHRPEASFLQGFLQHAWVGIKYLGFDPYSNL